VFNVRAKVIEGKGNLGVGFKFTTPFNHWIVVLSIGKKSELKLLRMNPRVFVLSKVVLDPLLAWISIRIVTIDDSVSVWINKKAVLKDHRDSLLKDARGTYMFGTNGLIAAFSDIKVTSLMPDGFKTLKDKNKKNDKDKDKDKKPDGASERTSSNNNNTDEDDEDKLSSSKSGKNSSDDSVKEEELE